MEDFEVHLGHVRGSVERYVKFRLDGGSDAEDVLQDIYTTAYLKFGQLKDKAAFKSWILAIARNHCTDYFRRQGSVQEVSLDEVPEGKLCYGRQGILVTSPVEDTLELLTEKDRQILRLVYWQQLSQGEIAKRLGVPVGTVKSRLYTAKQHFKSQYPYPPREPKGETMKTKLPKRIPDYTIEWLEEKPFPVKWEETQGWLIVPRLGEKLSWGMYDFPEKTRTSWCEMAVVGKAEIHGIQGVEITATQYGEGDYRDPGFVDSMERRFVAQLTDTHCRYLAESHIEDGVRKCYTFLDGEEFTNNWGFGENNCGNEVNLIPKGVIQRRGDITTVPACREVIDAVGCCNVSINGKTYKTVCVMDIELYNEAVVSEQYVDQNGRTVLWRRFNRDNWAIDRFGGKLWSEKLPENERITINGETYVHWYDCISDYIL